MVNAKSNGDAVSDRINPCKTGKNNQNTKTGGRGLTYDTVKQQVAEKLWLNYFNQTLYERGIINEHEHNRMAFKIENTKQPVGKKTIISVYVY